MKEEKCQSIAEELHTIVGEEITARSLKGVEISEPLPAYYPRLGGEFRYQMILRSRDPLPLLNSLPLRGWKVMIDPSNLL